MATSDTSGSNFIEKVIAEDLASGRFDDRVVTRFPPEPNGYLHIGHAKSICLNFGLAAEHAGGRCHLRFDDTNPTKEEVEYVDSIMADVRWLGFDWGPHLYYASDYFEQLYDWAVQLIRAGRAYVDDQSAEEIRAIRGTLTEPGRESPWRNRSVEENLDLFARMRAGEFPDGSRVLRAKIDMASPNLNLRDPTMYRIRKVAHHRTGERVVHLPDVRLRPRRSRTRSKAITHSICTLEYEDHRPLYDWYLDQLGIYHPQQIEFARLNLSHTVLSKRQAPRAGRGRARERLGRSAHADHRRATGGAATRRRPSATSASGSAWPRRTRSWTTALLEHCLREDLNRRAPRAMAVLRPLRLVIENYPEGQEEMLEAVNNPEDPAMGTRQVPFSRVLYIEQDDFREQPPKKYFRLFPGNEVRLRYAYLVRCTDVVKDERTGEVVEVRCTYDPATRGGDAPDGRRVKSTIHWVSAAHAVEAEVRLYEPLFTAAVPGADKDDWKADLNPRSLERLTGCRLEPSLAAAAPGARYQFERNGYFCVDVGDSAADRPVWNRAVGLRDSWAKIEKAGE